MLFSYYGLSVAIGLIIGYIYALSFVTQQKKVFAYRNGWSLGLSTVFFIIFRIVLLGLIGFYLLHYSAINLILVMSVFLITFWLIIITKKAY